MTGWLEYDGVDSLSLGFYTTGTGTHNAPERDVTVFSIAGRNGDLVVDNGKYKNIEVTYPCFTMDLAGNEQDIRNHFAAYSSYFVLADSYDPDHFRLARPVGGIEFEAVRPNAANFELTFDCDPRRYLTTGLVWTTITGGVLTMTNPTSFGARPLFRISGIAVGTEIAFTDLASGNVVTFTATAARSGQTYIDCETQNIYGINLGMNVNLNSLFEVDGEFPVFGGSANRIEITGTYSSAAVRPRWWEL